MRIRGLVDGLCKIIKQGKRHAKQRSLCEYVCMHLFAEPLAAIDDNIYIYKSQILLIAGFRPWKYTNKNIATRYLILAVWQVD